MSENSYELIKLGRNRTPAVLIKRLDITTYVEEGKPLLHPFVEESLIPESLDLILIRDWDWFYAIATNAKTLFFGPNAWYVSKQHCWAETENKALSMLEQEANIKTSRAILMPNRRKIDYWGLIHELLHDVFNHLPEEQRRKILESARASYHDLSDMLDITMLNITRFMYREHVAQSYKRRTAGQKGPYLLIDLSEREQLQCVDEFISSLFADVSEYGRRQHLLERFKETLREVGYKVDSAPVTK